MNITDQLLENRGNVLPFEKFVSESVDVSIDDDSISVQNDDGCFEAVWKILESECGGNIEKLVKFLEKNGSPVRAEEVLQHIADLVGQFLKPGVNITHGKQRVKNIKSFYERATEIDVWVTVEELYRKLAGTCEEPHRTWLPKFDALCKQIRGFEKHLEKNTTLDDFIVDQNQPTPKETKENK